MRRSDERILTTHVGSLPRPPALRDLLIRQERGEAIDEALLRREVETAVRLAVRGQLRAGVDVGNDGEQPRVGFSTYVARRLSGFGGEAERPTGLDIRDFPDYGAMLASRRAAAAKILRTPQALAAVRYTGLDETARECDLFREIADAEPDRFSERFMTAASPGIIATTLLDGHYGSHARYVEALAAEMKQEYDLIHQRGLLLQLDCPDLAMERPRFFQAQTLDQFLQAARAEGIFDVGFELKRRPQRGERPGRREVGDH